MKSVFLFLAKNRKNGLMKLIRKATMFAYYAFENKNNDHHTNGEFWLMTVLASQSPKVVFDVGANVGLWSLEANSIFAKAKICSFEPIPEVFDKLKAATSKSDRISIFRLALSESKGTVTFNYYPKARLFSSMYSHFKGGESVSTQVETLDGDGFCRENAIDGIDFLKLDVEGAEHLVLKGFDKMLEGQKIKAIQFEYGIFSLESRFLLKDYFAFFEKHHYIVGKIYPNYVDFREYSWELENFFGPNYLAIRRSDFELIKLLQ